MEIFLQNLERIAEHNIRYRNGEVTYTLGMNRFGDLTHPEFVARFNGYKSNGLAKKAGKTFMKPANFQAPASMDWRTEGFAGFLSESIAFVTVESSNKFRVSQISESVHSKGVCDFSVSVADVVFSDTFQVLQEDLHAVQLLGHIRVGLAIGGLESFPFVVDLMKGSGG